MPLSECSRTNANLLRNRPVCGSEAAPGSRGGGQSKVDDSDSTSNYMLGMPVRCRAKQQLGPLATLCDRTAYTPANLSRQDNMIYYGSR